MASDRVGAEDVPTLIIDHETACIINSYARTISHEEDGASLPERPSGEIGLYIRRGIANCIDYPGNIIVQEGVRIHPHGEPAVVIKNGGCTGPPLDETKPAIYAPGHVVDAAQEERGDVVAAEVIGRRITEKIITMLAENAEDKTDWGLSIRRPPDGHGGRGR